MNHTPFIEDQDQIVGALNVQMNTLLTNPDELNDNERNFIRQVRQLNRMLDSGCERFQLLFRLSEVYAAQSLLKYDESFAHYRDFLRTYAR